MMKKFKVRQQPNFEPKNRLCDRTSSLAHRICDPKDIIKKCCLIRNLMRRHPDTILSNMGRTSIARPTLTYLSFIALSIA